MTLLDELNAQDWFSDASNEQLKGLKQRIEKELCARHEKAVNEAIDKLHEAWLNLRNLGVAVNPQCTISCDDDIEWNDFRFIDF